MNIKKYKLVSNFSEIEIEIDHDKVSDEMLHGINDFWDGSDYRLSMNDGNVLSAVLKMLAVTIIHLAIKYDCSDNKIIRLFDHDKGSVVEGWPKMDGSTGFKIISVVYYLPTESEINVEEIT